MHPSTAFHGRARAQPGLDSRLPPATHSKTPTPRYPGQRGPHAPSCHAHCASVWGPLPSEATRRKGNTDPDLAPRRAWYAQRREGAAPRLLFSGSVMSHSLRPQGLKPTRLLCPRQEYNRGFLCLLHWQAGSLVWSHLGSPAQGWWAIREQLMKASWQW